MPTVAAGPIQLAGCVYDAPAYPQTIRHKIHMERDLGALGHMVDEGA